MVDSALKVHSALGPGLLESAYEACLAYELAERGNCGNSAETAADPITAEVEIDAGYRLDLLVDDQIVVELKTVSSLLPVHEAQLLSYLKLGDFHLGFLLNFNVRRMKEGIRRMLNGYTALASFVPFVVKII